MSEPHDYGQNKTPNNNEGSVPKDEFNRQSIKELKAKKRMGSAAKFVLALAFLLLSATALLVVWNHVKPEPSPDPDPFPVVITEERLVAIQEVATEKFEYTAYKDFGESRKLLDWDIPFTERRFLLIYQGEMKAYFDMSKAQVSATDSEITIILPQISVSHYIDGDAVTIKKNIFYPFDLEEKPELEDDLKTIEESRAIKQGFIDEARSNVDKMLHAMYDGVLQEGQTLVVKQSDEAIAADEEYINNTNKKAKKLERELDFKTK